MKVRMRGYNLLNKYDRKLGKVGTPEYDKIPSKMTINIHLPYFPAYKTHPDFFVRNFRKNNDECILIL
jgi:hypothetical protein